MVLLYIHNDRCARSSIPPLPPRLVSAFVTHIAVYASTTNIVFQLLQQWIKKEHSTPLFISDPTATVLFGFVQYSEKVSHSISNNDGKKVRKTLDDIAL
ncbi:hypothetical protein L1887_13714 [Cichorium endivia]|nr:hypothetical protein L1887_13714 [Cichorium endivia]